MNDSTQLRLRLIGVVIVSLMAALVARLWFLQSVENEELRSDRRRQLAERGPHPRVERAHPRCQGPPARDEQARHRRQHRSRGARPRAADQRTRAQTTRDADVPRDRAQRIGPADEGGRPAIGDRGVGSDQHRQRSPSRPTCRPSCSSSSANAKTTSRECRSKRNRCGCIPTAALPRTCSATWDASIRRS